MTLDEMKVLLAGRLGQRTDIDDMIYREIRQAQRALEKTPPYPWFLLDDTVQHYAEHVVDLPDDFIELFGDIIFIVGPSDGSATFMPAHRIYGGEFEHVHDNKSGLPGKFAIIGSGLVFYPAPNVSYLVTYIYYHKQPVLATGASENLWSKYAEDLLVSEAGWHVARNIRDAEAATLFGQDRAEARRRIAQESTSRHEAMRRAVIGGGEDMLLEGETFYWGGGTAR